MTYSETVRFLYGLQQHGIKLGLETIRALLTGSASRSAAIPCSTSAGPTARDRRPRWSRRSRRPPAIA